MKRNIIQIFITHLLISTLIGCTETNNSIKAGDKPIIEAYLVPNQSVSLSVKTEIPYSDDNSSKATSQPVDGLVIKIVGGGKTFTLKSEGKGIYSSAKTELIKNGGTYQMSFDYQGKKVFATTTIPSKPSSFVTDKTEISRTQIDLSGGGFPNFGATDDNSNINLTWKNPDKEYHLFVAENIETSPVKIIKLPTTVSDKDQKDIEKRFRLQPDQSSGTIIRPQQFTYFGKYWLILYKVNTDYADLYNSSGTSSQNISTPPSAIENGLGIFTGINADTLKFNIKKK